MQKFRFVASISVLLFCLFFLLLGEVKGVTSCSSSQLYGSNGFAIADTSKPPVPGGDDVEPQSETIDIAHSPSDDMIYSFTQAAAEFPGGQEALMKYLQVNLRFPEEEKAKNLSGTVYVIFVVEKDGLLSNIRIRKGVPGASGFDKEALRVVSQMPKWKPGEIEGAAVRSEIALPIRFISK